MGASSAGIKQDTHYTYADYCAWDTDERYELIDGIPYLMSPAPKRTHQRILLALSSAFHNYLRGKSCELFVAPFDVRLNADTDDDTVVQPDLMVVCDKNKLEEAGIKGAPDLVIEILSPSSRNYDSTLKLGKYLQAGVKECWLVDTQLNTVRVFTRDENGVETMKVYDENATVPVGILPGFSISLPEVFAAVRR